MAIAILVSTFGCNNGLILAGARVYYAMARDSLFFRQAGTLHPEYRTPVFALIAQAIWTMVLCISGTYGELLNYVVFAALLFYALTARGALPAPAHPARRARPVKAFGYPVLPALYIVATASILIVLLVDPQQRLYSGLGLLLVILGRAGLLALAQGGPDTSGPRMNANDRLPRSFAALPEWTETCRSAARSEPGPTILHSNPRIRMSVRLLRRALSALAPAVAALAAACSRPARPSPYRREGSGRRVDCAGGRIFRWADRADAGDRHLLGVVRRPARRHQRMPRPRRLKRWQAREDAWLTRTAAIDLAALDGNARGGHLRHPSRVARVGPADPGVPCRSYGG